MRFRQHISQGQPSSSAFAHHDTHDHDRIFMSSSSAFAHHDTHDHDRSFKASPSTSAHIDTHDHRSRRFKYLPEMQRYVDTDTSDTSSHKYGTNIFGSEPTSDTVQAP